MPKSTEAHKIITASILLLALFVFALAGHLAWKAYEGREAAREIARLNRMADRIIVASSLEAIERGTTSAALGTPGATDAATLLGIAELRRAGDAAWNEALAIAGEHVRGLPDESGLHAILRQALEAHQDLARMRARVDAELRQPLRHMRAEEWLETITRFISRTAKLRETALMLTDSSHEIAQLNITLKQQLWLVSEYAGLERGTLAFYIGGRMPVPARTLGELRSFRGLVDYNVAGIRVLKNLPETDARIARAIEAMERGFLGDYERTRKGVYRAAPTGEYGLSGQEWFRRATGAIDSVLAVLMTASQVIEEKAQAAEARSQRLLLLHLGLLAVTLTLSLYSSTRVVHVANALFHEKELAEVTLHSIGDAVVTTDAHAVIEYINPVAEELTGWTLAEARGRPLAEVFNIVNGSTREPQTNPAEKCLKEQRIVGLENNTVLIRRDGQEVLIEDSAAPVRDRKGDVIGAVMVFFDATHTRNMPHLLSYQATHDALTGLINRREFERRLVALLESARIAGKHHALLYLDLDQFKVVNDTCGHAAGDKLLRLLTYALKSRVRDADSLARLGGDEFGVLLEACSLEPALALAEGLRRIVKEFHFVWQDKTFEIGVSIGLVPITPESASVTELLSEADAACYAAKDKGRDRIQVYQPGDAELARRHGEMRWVARLNEALAQNRFRLYYQTILALNSHGSGPRAELLLRLQEEDGGIVPPAAFLPAAERFNLMPAIDRWVIRQAFEELARVRRRHPGRPRSVCSINLSGASLNDEKFLDFVNEQFLRSGMEPPGVCFEITETAAIANLDQAIAFMEALKRKGCCFALDDFGSGMSSFVYLKHLPVSYLKISGAFILNIVANPVDRAIVDAICRIGQVMDIKTIAEFVENDAILEKLRELCVDYAQGYAISHPQPLDEHFAIHDSS
jgi:diguanylate cyclase (GGDEF)-like protein/PAS domain S-box-containing protein